MRAGQAFGLLHLRLKVFDLTELAGKVAQLQVVSLFDDFLLRIVEGQIGYASRQCCGSQNCPSSRSGKQESRGRGQRRADGGQRTGEQAHARGGSGCGCACGGCRRGQLKNLGDLKNLEGLDKSAEYSQSRTYSGGQ